LSEIFEVAEITRKEEENNSSGRQISECEETEVSNSKVVNGFSAPLNLETLKEHEK
jgi:hypothetical protein